MTINIINNEMICIQKYLIFKSVDLLEDIIKLIVKIYINPRMIKINVSHNDDFIFRALSINNTKTPYYVYNHCKTYRTDGSFKVETCGIPDIGVNLYHHWTKNKIEVRSNKEFQIKINNPCISFTQGQFKYIYLS